MILRRRRCPQQPDFSVSSVSHLKNARVSFTSRRRQQVSFHELRLPLILPGALAPKHDCHRKPSRIIVICLFLIFLEAVPETTACLGTLPAQDVIKLPCTDCIIEVSKIECGRTCTGNFERARNSQGCSIVQCPSSTVLAIEDERGEFSLLNGLLCNSQRRWTGADWSGPTTVFAKCLPLCQSCGGIQKYNGDCPLDQCTDLAPPLIDENGCARMLPVPGYGLFARVDGQLKQTDYLECTSEQVWMTSNNQVSETLAISARPTPECALCSNLHFPRNLLKDYAYYIHDEPKIDPITGCQIVTCSAGRQMLVSPTNEPLVAVSQLSCNDRRRWIVDADPNEFAFMNVVCGAPSQCAGCNLQVTTDFCPTETCEDLALLQEYTDEECLQFSCGNEKTLYALTATQDVVTASFIQCSRDWNWMTNTGILLSDNDPTLGCASGPLRCIRCPEISKYSTCPDGHVCYSVPPPVLNEFGCAEVTCLRGQLQIAGIPTLGVDTRLTCNYEREWTVVDAEGKTGIGESVTANCAVASECANCGLVTLSSACLTQRCEPFLEVVTEEDCKQIICPLGQQLYNCSDEMEWREVTVSMEEYRGADANISKVEVGSGDLQPVDRLECTSLGKEWVSESEDAYGENVKVACGAGPLKCTLCSNLTASDHRCPQVNCLNVIEYNLESGCKRALCPIGQTLYLERDDAERVVEVPELVCESDLGWYAYGRLIGPDASVICGDGPHLCAMCTNPAYTKECPLNAFCDPLQMDELDSADECMQYTCKGGYSLHVDDEGKWLAADYLQCTDYDTLIAVGKNFTVENVIVTTCVSECSQCSEMIAECSQCSEMPYLTDDCPFPGFCQNLLTKQVEGPCTRTVCNDGLMHIKTGSIWRAVEGGVQCDAERRWTYLGERVRAAVCTSCACSVDFYNENGLDEFCEGWSECLALYPLVSPSTDFAFELPPDRCSFKHRCPIGFKLLMRVEKANGQRESLVYEDVHPRDYEVAFVCSPQRRFQFVKRQGQTEMFYGIRHVLCAREA